MSCERKTARHLRTPLWLALLATSNCGLSQTYELANGSVRRFHEQLAAGEFDGIYGQATEHFRTSMSPEVARGYFARIKRKMGACTTSRATAFSLNTTSGGTSVVAAYQTQCANGPLIETFTWRLGDGKAMLDEYRSESPLLMVE
jgi:hypothetical protein